MSVRKSHCYLCEGVAHIAHDQRTRYHRGARGHTLTGSQARTFAVHRSVVEAKGKHPGKPGPCNCNRHGNAFERAAEGLPSAPPHPRQAEGGGVMGYIAESLEGMSGADLRAWAFAQSSPGFIEDRIAEAERLISWLLPRPFASAAPLSASEPHTIGHFL